MESTTETTRELLRSVLQLSDDWHSAGSFPAPVLRAIARHALKRKITHSAETGAGKTTLLFSHLSQDHKVFVLDVPNSFGEETNTLERVSSSSLLKKDVVEFVTGPSQKTLPNYKFDHPLQLVLLDGPHGYPFPDLEYYFFYPHIEKGGLLIVDDIHIPTIHNMFRFIKEDAMWSLAEVVQTTAFFRRTSAPLTDPYGDNWWQQAYNVKRFPAPATLKYKQRIQALIPQAVSAVPKPVRKGLKKLIGK